MSALIASGVNATINADLMLWLTPAFARHCIQQRMVHGEQADRYELVAAGKTHAAAIEALRANRKATKRGLEGEYGGGV